MPLESLASLIAQYQELKRKTEHLGVEFDEMQRRSDEVGELYLASKQELENMQMSVMEAFASHLDSDETIQ